MVAIDSGLLQGTGLPMHFLLAVGPLLYFYVLKLTRPQYKLQWKDGVHFIPVAASYFTPALPVLVFISMMAYLYHSNRLIQSFYRRLQPVFMDRPLVAFRWLRRLLAATALLWCLWIVCVAINDLIHRNQLFYPFYLFFAVLIVWTAAAAFLNTRPGTLTQMPMSIKPPIPAELRAKAAWLKKVMATNRYFEEPELSLAMLAEKLNMAPHDVSRLINTVFKKSFNDFVNEFRVRDVVSRLQDPASKNLTLLGIAMDAGFNSKSTFNRAFRQMTGKTPAEFKNDLENKGSSYHLTPRLEAAAVISGHPSRLSWVDVLNHRQYMIKNYFRTAWRSLARNKMYSLVNVLGLALGICACLVIYLITRHEFSFDTFHPDRDRIYCVDAGMHNGHMHCVPGPLPAAMRRGMTGVETVAAFHTFQAGVTVPGGPNEKPKRFVDDGSLLIAEPDYFNIFQYRWLSGNAATALSAPNTVVLTAEKARRYFGGLPPNQVIGRTLYYQDSLMVRVTGVVADWTGNSDYNFRQWISYATIPASFLKTTITLDDWGKIEMSSKVMVKLAKDVRPEQLDAQLMALVKPHYNRNLRYSARLQPLSGVHFNRDYGGVDVRKASKPVLYTLMAVAIFILILAIVNFVNLSTAQSMQRAREIGVRKVLGGGRSGIAVQFLAETLLLTLAAVFIAALMVTPMLGLFADMIPGEVRFRPDGATLLFLLLVIAATALLAGFYPAKVLSKYQPTLTLKGITAVPGGGKGALRRALIVFQFTISLLFIIASLVVGAQLRYALHADLGFKTDAIITVASPEDDTPGKMAFGPDRRREPPGKKTDHTAVLMEKIRSLAGVEQVIREWRQPLDRKGMHFGGGRLKGSDDKPIKVSVHSGNHQYLPFYQMRLVAGRNMLPGDSIREVLITESCAHALGFADVRAIIGREMEVGPREVYPIAGVVADFFESDFRRPNMPAIIKPDPRMSTTIAVKVAAASMTAGELHTLIGRIEKQWKTVYPGKPFSYSFLDENIAMMYADDLRTEFLINVAMGITVFISCLGLLGLAIFSTEKRGREIGIRKVFGATVANILTLLCKEIVVLILIALLIATPLAWYCMHQWLQGFAYRTEISVWMFIGAGMAAIGVALLTVGFQTVRAANMNPVKVLRSE